jgi:23S rRNA (pseudouridine1915-N3)-methyltransferase
MKIKVLLIGKSFPEFTKESIDYFTNKIKHFVAIEWVEIVMKKTVDHVDTMKQLEGEAFEKYIDKSDVVILLDDKGKKYTSEQFAQFVQNKQDTSIKTLTFLVGGAYGFSQKIYERADGKLSLSDMTFSHQIIRPIFLEQIYRAYTIMKGIPYHHA